MANKEHLRILKEGADVWLAWRREHPEIQPDLQGATLRNFDLSDFYLCEANLRKANLTGANLKKALLYDADCSHAVFSKANLEGAGLNQGKFIGAVFSEANLIDVSLKDADLTGVDLRKADLLNAYLGSAVLYNADLREAQANGPNFSTANLSGANLSKAFFNNANFYSADMRNADLRNAMAYDAKFDSANLSDADMRGMVLTQCEFLGTNLRGTDLTGATLSCASLIDCEIDESHFTGCRIFGLSAWGLKGQPVDQSNLIIEPFDEDEPVITVDNLEVAQFIYLLLHNQKIRRVIDTITSKLVLILGRFTEERKPVLDAIRNELRGRDYLPVLFDFDKPATRDLTETISTLAHMARFIIADITDPRSIPQELGEIVPNLPSVPVQPLLSEGTSEYGMFEHFKKYPWVLAIHRYRDQDDLLSSLKERVIEPAEAKVNELREGKVR